MLMMWKTQTRIWRFHSCTIGSTSKHVVGDCSCCAGEVGSQACGFDVAFCGHFLCVQYCCHVAAIVIPWESLHGVFGYVYISLLPSASFLSPACFPGTCLSLVFLVSCISRDITDNEHQHLGPTPPSPQPH
jgi:hypothetical protein